MAMTNTRKAGKDKDHEETIVLIQVHSSDLSRRSKTKTLGDARFRSNDSLYISIHLPPTTGGPLANASGALFSVRGSAGRPEAKGSNSGFPSNDGPGLGAGAPQGEGSWIEARKEHPPPPPANSHHTNARGDRRNGGGNAGGRGRSAPGGNDRYFESRQRSRSPQPRRGGAGGARRPSPSY